MSISVQNRVSPMGNIGGMDKSAGLREEPKALDSVQSVKTDFKDLLSNSNAEVKTERERMKNGDLSGTTNDADFLQKLNQSTVNPNQRVPRNTMDKDDFLRLFIAQIQNQDPTSPQDSSQMAAQLAQFNGLEQMLNMNKTLGKLVDNQKQDQRLSMLNYLNKEIAVAGDRLEIKGGRPTSALYSLGQESAETTVSVKDQAGAVIFTKQLGQQLEGEHRFEWNGLNKEGKPATDGIYSVVVSAADAKGTELPTSMKSSLRVTGIDLKDGGTLLTGMGTVALADVISVTESSPGSKRDEGIDNSQQRTPTIPTPSPLAIAQSVPEVIVESGTNPSNHY